MIPGELLVDDGDVELNAGRATCKLRVANRGESVAGRNLCRGHGRCCDR